MSRAYGLLKAHKIPIDDNNNLKFSNNLPFRLVISCIDSFKYFFSQLYEEILSSSVNKPPQNIKNSVEFLEKIKNIKIPENYVMMSLDVVSMYPTIPLDLIKKGINNRWNEIKKYTDIPINEFLIGLDVLVNSTYFKIK